MTKNNYDVFSSNNHPNDRVWTSRSRSWHTPIHKHTTYKENFDSSFLSINSKPQCLKIKSCDFTQILTDFTWKFHFDFYLSKNYRTWRSVSNITEVVGNLQAELRYSTERLLQQPFSITRKTTCSDLFLLGFLIPLVLHYLGLQSQSEH